MFTDYVNNSTGLAESVKTNTSLSTITRMLGGSFQNDFLEKNLTPDQKAALASNSMFSDPTMLTYNQRLLPDSPLSESSISPNVYNDLKSLPNGTRNDAAENLPWIAADNIMVSTEALVKSNPGFYMVLNRPANSERSKMLKGGKPSEFQIRINNTYGLQEKSDPGKLVDLVF